MPFAKFLRVHSVLMQSKHARATRLYKALLACLGI